MMTENRVALAKDTSGYKARSVWSNAELDVRRWNECGLEGFTSLELMDGERKLWLV